MHEVFDNHGHVFEHSLLGKQRAASTVFFFKIKFIQFLDTVILYIYFLIIKINIYRGDLSDISAKMATLAASPSTSSQAVTNRASYPDRGP